MAVPSPLLELYMKKRNEIKILKEPSTGSKDRLSTFVVHCHCPHEYVDAETLMVLYSVIKETITTEEIVKKDRTFYEKMIYSLTFERKENTLYVSWIVKNCTPTIIDDKLILSEIYPQVEYLHDYDGDLEKNWHHYDVFTLRFNDVIQVDNAIMLARSAILETTLKNIHGFSWILKVKNGILIYVMSWTTKLISFPECLFTPTGLNVRRIFNEDQLKAIILENCDVYGVTDQSAPKIEGLATYRIKKAFSFESMNCIEYLIYAINHVSRWSNKIIYRFHLSHVYYDQSLNQCIHRIRWILLSQYPIEKALTKQDFIEKNETKRQRE
jgi:hypothetical protein